MMKRIFSIILSLSLLATGLCACTDSGDSSDTHYDGTPPHSEGEPTVPVTDTAASEETEAPATEAPTDAVTVDPAVLEAEKQAKMKEIFESTPAVPLPIGGWSTPASALRDGYTGTEGSYDRVWATLAESGVNFMITLEIGRAHV